MTSLYENQLLWDGTIYHTDQARLALFVYRAYYITLLYIQLSFSLYLTCKWKGAVSYDTRPGTGLTGSGTIFSLVTTAGKFNRERRFWSLYEVFQILQQMCYSVLLARHCESFITAGQRNRYDFLCLFRITSRCFEVKFFDTLYDCLGVLNMDLR